MTSTATGHMAEAAAARHLQREGYEVLATNWRGRHCEIDIVAKKRSVMYLCEVKYRETLRQGGGIEYITPTKLRQMARAADTWAQYHDWTGEYQLCAIEVSGPDFIVTAFIDGIYT